MICRSVKGEVEGFNSLMSVKTDLCADSGLFVRTVFLLRWYAVSFPRSGVTAIKLSIVGAGRARDDGAITLQSRCKYRGLGPLLRSVVAVTLRRGNAVSDAPALPDEFPRSSVPFH